jgi:predicted RNA binding protein YcfA (HicA-like mRNA interferase family)
MRSLSNITIKELRAVLTLLGLVKLRVKGGHEAWMKSGMTRPIIFQTHIEPIPTFIIRNCIRDLGISKDDFLELLEKI